MNTFEERLLNFLTREIEISREDVLSKFSSDPEFDAKMVDEYFTILSVSNSLKDFRQADLQEAWQKIVTQTDIEEDLKDHSHSEYSAKITAMPLESIRTNGANGHGKKSRTTKDDVEEIELPSTSVSDSKKVGLRRWAVAASLLIAGSLVAYFLLQDPYEETLAVSDMEIVLPDMSIAKLTAGSSITYLKKRKFLAAERREVAVSGDVIFDVRSMPSKPFIVKSDLTHIEVLGTVFRFQADGALSSAENIEGLVKFGVTEGTDSITLEPRDKASYDGNEFKVEKYQPPAPPPPPPPTNTLVAADLLDILGDKYQILLEMAPYMEYNFDVVDCNLNDDLGTLLLELSKNSNVDVDYSYRGNQYRLNKLVGKDSGLKADYTFFDYLNGKPFKIQD